MSYQQNMCAIAVLSSLVMMVSVGHAQNSTPEPGTRICDPFLDAGCLLPRRESGIDFDSLIDMENGKFVLPRSIVIDGVETPMFRTAQELDRSFFSVPPQIGF